MDVIWTVKGRAGRGRGMVIAYDTEELKPFGPVLVARTERGICFLGLPVDNSFERAVFALRAYFPQAEFVNTPVHAHVNALDVYGTEMQIAVWKALLKIPEGQTRTYKQIADAIGRPKASRPVGNAVGSNPVTLYIPCHRVIGTNGNIHGFGWGRAWKERILESEFNAVKAGKSVLV